MPRHAKTRLSEDQYNNAVNVSAAFNHCFFHCVALHYLCNQIDFPPTLFEKHDHDNEKVIELKEIFHDIQSFDLLNHFREEEREGSSNFLFEKSLILGFFFRSLFVELLLHDTNNQMERLRTSTDITAKGIDERSISFLGLIDYFYEVETSKIETDEMKINTLDTFNLMVAGNPIYEANKSFFSELNSDEARAHWCNRDWDFFQTYWLREGYRNYCYYLNKPNVKISYGDFISSLDLIVYDYDNKIEIVSSTAKSDLAEDELVDSPIAMEEFSPNLLEIALNVKNEHYYLIPNEKNKVLLAEYSAQFAQYLKDRELLQRKSPHDVIIASKEFKSSPFLLAILPPSCLKGKNPLTLLVNRIKGLLHGDSQLELRDEELEVYEDPDEMLARNLQEEEESNNLARTFPYRDSNASDAILLHRYTLEEKKYKELLKEFKSLVDCYEGNKKIELTSLHSQLEGYFETYLDSQKYYFDLHSFRQLSVEAIGQKKTILEKHDNLWDKMFQIIGNLFLGIISIGAAFGLNHRYNNRYFLFAPQTAQITSKIEALLEDIKPPLVEENADIFFEVEML